MMIFNLFNLFKPSKQHVKAEVGIAMCTEMKGMLIDVREPSECLNGAISTAVNIPLGSLSTKVSSLCLSLEQPIFIHCASGMRAKMAIKLLKQLGYENLWAITSRFADVQQAVNKREFNQ